MVAGGKMACGSMLYKLQQFLFADMACSYITIFMRAKM
jgi:hypothetical protein